MSPDSPESRIGRLEQTVAALKQQVSDLGEDVRAFGPLVAQMAILSHDVSRIEVSLMNLATKFEEREEQTRKERDERDKRERQAQADALKDSRNWRRALILGSFTVLAAVIAAAATIIAAGVG